MFPYRVRIWIGIGITLSSLRFLLGVRQKKICLTSSMCSAAQSSKKRWLFYLENTKAAA